MIPEPVETPDFATIAPEISETATLERPDLAAAYRPIRATGTVFTVIGIGGDLVLAGAALGLVDCTGFDCLGPVLLGGSGWGLGTLGGLGAGVTATAGLGTLNRHGVHVSPAPVAAFWSTLGLGAALIVAGDAVNQTGDYETGDGMLIGGATALGVSGIIGMVAERINADAARHHSH